jgi:hypothetical protein
MHEMDAPKHVKPPFPKSTVCLNGDLDTGMTFEQFHAFKSSLTWWEAICCYFDFEHLIRLANTKGFRKFR